MTGTDASVAQPVSASGQRLATIDILRGLIIVIMVLDHVRDYTHISGFKINPLDFQQTHTVLYLTRWVTHLCAPTFIFLAGVSAWLQNVRGKSGAALSGFLLTRGLWLIVLEVTVVGFGWSFALPMPLFLAILWAIGWSMIALSALVWLPRRAVLAIGIAIITLHNLLGGINADQLGPFSGLWHFLFQVNIFKFAGFDILLFYPVLPWIGVIAFGYGMGEVFLKPDRNRILTLCGLGLCIGFVLLRLSNVYGDPRPWAVQALPAHTLMDFFNVAKYPPSLLYTAATLGIVFLLTPGLDRLPASVASVLRTFGSVPMMAYLGHLYIMHLVSMAAHLIAGQSLATQFNPLAIAFFNPAAAPDDSFLPLWVTYLCWVITLCLLYPLCRYWSALKQRRKDWWLSYL